MANIILIKNGQGRPEFRTLYDGELGYDFQNETLYIGQNGFSIPIGGKRVEHKKNFHGNAINGLKVPEDSLQAANKQYVDSSKEEALAELKNLEKLLKNKIFQLEEKLNQQEVLFSTSLVENSSVQLSDNNYQVFLGEKELLTTSIDGTSTNNLILGPYILSHNDNLLTLM